MASTRRKPGQLGPQVEGCRAWLTHRGYTPQAIRNMLAGLGRAGRWMSREGLVAAQLDEDAMAAFLAARQAAGHRRALGPRAAAARVPRVPGRAVGAAGPEQDADRAGRRRAGHGSTVPSGAAAAVLPVGVPVGPGPGQRPAGTARTAPRPRTRAVSGWGRYGKTGNGVVTVTALRGRRAHLLPGARAALHPGQALREGEERPGVPHQAGDRRGAGRPGAGGRVCLPRDGGRQRLRGPGRVPRRARGGRAAVRDDPQAPPRDLGPRRRRAHPRRRGP